MKKNQTRKEELVTGPLLKDLVNRQKAESKLALKEVQVGSAPLLPADLYQDAGGGYNVDFTFPQD